MKQMSLAEAKAAGLLDRPKSKRKTQTVAPRSGSLSRCCTCDERFTGETAERRHSDETGHARFEMVL